MKQIIAVPATVAFVRIRACFWRRAVFLKWLLPALVIIVWSPLPAAATTLAEISLVMGSVQTLASIQKPLYTSVRTSFKNQIVGEVIYDIAFHSQNVMEIEYGVFDSETQVWSTRNPTFWNEPELAKEAGQLIIELLGKDKVSLAIGGRQDGFGIIYGYKWHQTGAPGLGWDEFLFVRDAADESLVTDLFEQIEYEDDDYWEYVKAFSPVTAIFTMPTLETMLDRLGYVAPPAPPAPVPEPATMILFGTGLAGLAGSRIRRRRKAKGLDGLQK